MATWGELEKAGTKWRDLEEMTWGELEEFCVINPKTKQIPDDMEVSFVPMQSVKQMKSEKHQKSKKDLPFLRRGMYSLQRLHHVWKTEKAELLEA